jgi:hypothetical protein
MRDVVVEKVTLTSSVSKHGPNLNCGVKVLVEHISSPMFPYHFTKVLNFYRALRSSPPRRVVEEDLISALCNRHS